MQRFDIHIDDKLHFLNTILTDKEARINFQKCIQARFFHTSNSEKTTQ